MKAPGRRLLLVAWLIPVIAFAIAPVVLLVWRSVRTIDAEGWQSLWGSSDAVWNTIVSSAGAAALALLLGTPLAFLLFRSDLHFRRAFTLLFTLPSAVPPFIWGMGWLSLANPRAGYLNRLLGEATVDIYGLWGIAFVLGLSGLPLVLLAAGAALRRMDPALDEAARVCGASPLRALLNTTLPLVLPSALSGAVMVFLMAASAFGVPYILGVSASPPTPVLTTRIYGYVLMGGESSLARAGVLASTLLLMTPVVLWLNHLFGRMGRVRLSSGKGVAARPFVLGRARLPWTLAVAGVALVVVVLPLAAVFLTSIQRSFGADLSTEGLTLSHWAQVLGAPRTLQAAARSALLAASAAALVCLFGVVAAVLARALPRAGRLVSPLATWPYAAPGTVLAIALLVAFSRDIRFVFAERIALVLTLAHSGFLLLIAYAGKYLALGTQNSSEALAQVDPSLEEAARVSGAGPLRAFMDAVLPLMRPAVAAAFLLTFLICATEITLSVLLVPAGQDVLGTLLFELHSYADPSAAAVLACAFVLLVVVGHTALAVLGRREGRAL